MIFYLICVINASLLYLFYKDNSDKKIYCGTSLQGDDIVMNCNRRDILFKCYAVIRGLNTLKCYALINHKNFNVRH